MRKFVPESMSRVCTYFNKNPQASEVPYGGMRVKKLNCITRVNTSRTGVPLVFHCH